MSAEVLQLSLAPSDVATDKPIPDHDLRLTIATAPDVMSPDTLSQVLDGIKVATLAEWRTKDRGKPVREMVGPPWRKLGGAVRYFKPDVVDWIERIPVSATS